MERKAVTTESGRTFRLVSVVDLRPMDYLTGKRLTLAEIDGNICDRCGREHAVVWEIEELTPGNERTWNVGPKCGPRILDGYSPEKSELRDARRADREAAEIAACARKAEELMAASVPVADAMPRRLATLVGPGEFQTYSWTLGNVSMDSAICDREFVTDALRRHWVDRNATDVPWRDRDVLANIIVDGWTAEQVTDHLAYHKFGIKKHTESTHA